MALQQTNLCLISFKLFAFGLLHCNCDSSNGMVVGSSLKKKWYGNVFISTTKEKVNLYDCRIFYLKSREDSQVDLVLNVVHHLRF